EAVGVNKRKNLQDSEIYLKSATACDRSAVSQLSFVVLRVRSYSLGVFPALLVAGSLSFARSPRSRKPIPTARGAARSSARSWRNSKSTISSGPTAMASLRYDNRAETRGDNCDSLRRR